MIVPPENPVVIEIIEVTNTAVLGSAAMLEILISFLWLWFAKIP